MKRSKNYNWKRFLRSRIHDLQLNVRSRKRARASFEPRQSFFCERLESRIVYAAVLSGNVLHITGDDSGPFNDQITISLKAGDPSNIHIQQNLAPAQDFLVASVNQIVVDGLAGDDSLTIDLTNGNPLQAGGLNFDGGTGRNVLVLTNGSESKDVHSLGPNPGQGAIDLTLTGTGAGSSFVHYQNLAPVNDYLAGPLVVNGSAASNAINYTVGRNDADTADQSDRGRVTVDNFEPIQFSNKTTLTVSGLGGDDVINLNNPNTPNDLTDIFVNGNDPTASDVLIVNGTTALDSIHVSLTGSDTADITGAGPVAIHAATIEQLKVNGQGNGDALTISTPGFDDIVYTPGANVDAGSLTVQNASLGQVLPVSFSNLGNAGTLAISSLFSVLEVNGTSHSDVFTVDGGTSTVQVLSNGVIPVPVTLPITTSGVFALTLHGLDGNDSFQLHGTLPYLQTTIDGGDPSASDSVTLYGTSSADAIGVALDAAGDTVTGFGGTVTLLGVENLAIKTAQSDDSVSVTNFGAASDLHHIAIDTGGDSDTLAVSTTKLADNITYTPTASDGGLLTANGVGPDLTFTGLGSTFTLDPLGGGDTLTVLGTTANDSISILLDATVSVQVNALKTIQVTTPANLDSLIVSAGAGADAISVSGAGALNSLLVNGQDNNDSLTVDFSSGNPIPTSGITFDGGLGNDSLTLSGGSETAETYSPGLIPGAGTIAITSSAKAGIIHFANIEPLIDTVSGPLTVNGTDANNAINLKAGSSLAQNSGVVSVDNYESIEFTNKTSLTISAGAGDDVINLNDATTPVGLTDIFVDGGDATASDKLIVNNLNASNPATFTPTAADAGDITFSAQPNVHFTTVEAVTINGHGNNNNLTVFGTAGNDTFNYTPGSTTDSGFVQVNALVPLTFINLGTTASVLLDGNGSDDTLVFNGSSLDDNVTVAATSGAISLTNAIGAYLPVTTRGITALKLNGLDGDDNFDISFATPFTSSITVSGGDPSHSDLLTLNGDPNAAESVTISQDANPTQQLITGLGTTMHVSGVELIAYTGVGSNDKLDVNTGPADNVIRVARGSAFDEVTSDSLPTIDFTGLDTFTLTPGKGKDVATFATTGLRGANHYNYDAQAVDVLVIEGQDGGANRNDSFTITNPVGGSVAVTDNNPLTPGSVTVTATNTIAGLEINTLGGDDSVTIDVGGTALITVPITFDGGNGHDSLTIQGTPRYSVTNSYTPGAVIDGGRLDYQGNGDEMIVDFAHLEPVSDSVPATSLTVNGTAAPNAISYSNIGTNGLVTVDGFESLTFTNKTQLVLNGGSGSDEISIHADAAPTGLTNIVVNGGDPTASDTLIVTGTSSFDGFRYNPTSASAGTVNVNALPQIQYTGIEHTVLDGQAGNDRFRIGANFGTVTVIGGDGSDTIDFRDSNRAVIFDMRKLDVAQRVSTGNEFVTLGDRVENFTGSDFNDLITTDVQPFAQSIDGGPVFGDENPATVPPGDTLTVDANGSVLTVKKTGAEDGTATGFGYAPITFNEIETLHTINTAGGSTGGTGSSLNNNAFNVSINYPTGHRPRGVVDADVNGDGHTDLVLTSRHEGVVQVMLGNGDGTFQAPLTFSSGGSHPTALAVGDFDGINGPDIAVVNGHSKDVVILENNGAPVPNFTISSTIPGLGKDARSIHAAQLDGINGDDLVVTNNHTSTVSVLLSAGGLSFSPPTSFATGGHQARDAQIVDLNGDGDLDIVTANYASKNISVLLNDGSGGFGAPALFTTGRYPTSITIGDLNHDGNQDVIVSNSSSAFFSVLLGDGAGAFKPQIQTKYPHGQRPQAIGIGDFNFDGILDIVVADRRSDQLGFVLGVGNGTFTAPIFVKVGNVRGLQPTSLDVGDFNQDGASDIAMINLETDNVSVVLRHV